MNVLNTSSYLLGTKFSLNTCKPAYLDPNLPLETLPPYLSSPWLHIFPLKITDQSFQNALPWHWNQLPSSLHQSHSDLSTLYFSHLTHALSSLMSLALSSPVYYQLSTNHINCRLFVLNLPATFTDSHCNQLTDRTTHVRRLSFELLTTSLRRSMPVSQCCL